jgi:hypothetical protein
MSNTDFINRLTASAQENPLAAALITGGLLWMVIGNRRLIDVVKTVGAASAPVVDTAVHSLHAEPLSKLNDGAEIPAAAGKILSLSTEKVSEWTEAAKEGLSGIRDRVPAIPDPRPAMAASYSEARSMLADMLERQPLVLGAMGLGIGAAVAGAFGATATERELMGSGSEAVRADVMARATAVAGKFREGADTLKAELGNSGAEAVDRLQQAGKDAVGAAREKAGV